MPSITGWITPSKEFVICKSYRHITIELLRDPRFSAIPEIAEEIKELDIIEQECEEDSERMGGTHAEWHRHEMAEDDLCCEAKQILLNNGFVRVGSSDDAVHFEARPNILKKHYQFLKDFAEADGSQAVFCPQK